MIGQALALVHNCNCLIFHKPHVHREFCVFIMYTMVGVQQCLPKPVIKTIDQIIVNNQHQVVIDQVWITLGRK